MKNGERSERIFSLFFFSGFTRAIKNAKVSNDVYDFILCLVWPGVRGINQEQKCFQLRSNIKNQKRCVLIFFSSSFT